MSRFLPVVLALLSTVPASAADGTLKLAFKYDGVPPKAAVPAGVAAVPFCAPLGVVEEGLVVGKNGGVQNVVMWMQTSSKFKAPVNPDIKDLPKEVKVDNKGCRYEPRITLLQNTQTLVVGNPDAIAHNTKGDFFANNSFNELIPAGGSQSFKLPKAEKVPMPLSCSIHTWMGDWVLIQDHPYFGASDSAGVLTIPHVPDGKYTFIVWREKGFVQKVKQKDKEIEWKSGRVDITIAGDTDLGTFLIK
ncbi:hypothetical protein [Anatilimnocola floriformis]|uniref:hypothetical protein n=1 Tax=Anatilimnocola floriformis TaxID=2948575 RepID=UPI0020C4A71F|nr:hypothetical protein [Anatilimnocola floriformis]